MEWIEAHGLADQGNPFFSAAARCGESETHSRDSIRVIGIERNSAFEVRERQIKLTAMVIGNGKKTMTPTLTSVQQERFAQEGFDGLLRDKTRPSRIKPLGDETAARMPTGRWRSPTFLHCSHFGTRVNDFVIQGPVPSGLPWRSMAVLLKRL